MKNHPAYDFVFTMYQRGETEESVRTLLEVLAAPGAMPKGSTRIVERLYRGFRSGLLGG
jgi:hypothetical protein